MYEFYHEGFFGYGEPGDFIMFSFWHFLPIAVLVACMLLVFHFRDKLRSWSGEGRFRFIYAFIMLVVEMSYFWRILYVGDETGGYSMLIRLPLQVCQWGLICSAFAMMSKNDTLYGIHFFVGLGLTVPALFTPSVITRTGPAYYRYYQFWLEHGMPLIAIVYMGAVHGKRPKYRHIWLSTALLILLSVPCVIANHTIPNANYMYLGNYAPGSTVTIDPLSFMPKSQAVRYICTTLAVVVIFHVIYFAWKGFTSLYQKRKERNG